MKLTPVAKFTTLFSAEFTLIAVSFDSDYVERGINYAEKSFMTLTPEANFPKLFFSLIYSAIDVLLGLESDYAIKVVNYAKKAYENNCFDRNLLIFCIKLECL